MKVVEGGVAAKVFHRDLKPKNILANSDCKLKVIQRMMTTGRRRMFAAVSGVGAAVGVSMPNGTPYVDTGL